MLYHLEGGKALFAGKTFSAATYAGVVVGRTGIHNAAVGITAKRAFHARHLLCQGETRFPASPDYTINGVKKL
ncbi:hypothetical protein SDC9_196845 [bioreactor metagenome]|uniref:Uncharacterized protein n=1 Tax=bioreactor metagenome TaxID=1076179 RepID=A0A645IDM5_9ZZZZ